MDIEHVKCLSWFRGSGESHVQDGERLMRAATLCKVLRPVSASSDPAMALEPSCARDGTMIGPSLKSAAASLPDGLGGWPGIRFMERANDVARKLRQRRIPSRSINALYRA